MKAARCIFRSVVLIGTALTAQATTAHESHHEGVKVEYSWARPTPPVKPINGAAYFVISNHSDKPVVLEGISTPVTDMASIHRTREEDGTLRMDAVEGGLEIAPGETVRFEPNSYHVMLMNLEKPLKEGETFSMTLEFVHQDDIELDVRIEHGSTAAASEEMSGHHH